MTKQEFIDAYGIEDGTIFLEDWETYSKGIIGISHDHQHVIYSHNKLVDAVAEYLLKKNDIPEDEAVNQAIEWIDYNTIRALPYMNEEFRPEIIFEVSLDSVLVEAENE